MKNKYLETYFILYDYIDKSEWLKQKFCELSSFYIENSGGKINEYDSKINEIEVEISNRYSKFKEQIRIMIEKEIIEDADLMDKYESLDGFIVNFIRVDGFQDTFFDFFDYNKVKLYTKDIEFLRNFVEENKLSNSLVKLESPAQKAYSSFSDSKKKLKSERIKSNIKSTTLDLVTLLVLPSASSDRLGEISHKATRKVIDINNKLSTESTLKEKNDYFENMTYEKAKIIVDSYDIINSCIEDSSVLINNKKELILKREEECNKFRIESINDCFKTKSDIERIKLEIAKYCLINSVFPKGKTKFETKEQYEFLTSLVDSFIESYADDINEILIRLVNQIKIEEISSIAGSSHKKKQ